MVQITLIQLRIMCLEAFYVYKSLQIWLDDIPERPCSNTNAEPDFGKCLKRAVEGKMNCTIPDMTSGIPTSPEGKLQRPLCSTPEQFDEYKRWFQKIAFQSEGGIYHELGCMAKCTISKYEIREGLKEGKSCTKITIIQFHSAGICYLMKMLLRKEIE